LIGFRAVDLHFTGALHQIVDLHVRLELLHLRLGQLFGLAASAGEVAEGGAGGLDLVELRALDLVPGGEYDRQSEGADGAVQGVGMDISGDKIGISLLRNLSYILNYN